jgi:GDP-L-fucose synthase
MAEPEVYPLTGKRVWVAGHRGMLGSALVRRLARENCELLSIDRAEADLTDQAAVQRWIERTRPQAALIAAAKVGGILANETYPADFLHENLRIASNVIGCAWKGGVERLLFLGSSCVYPKHAPQPIPESALLTGPLEPTNEWYALAKIAGIKLCQAYRRQHGADFISAMPTNLYGPGDNYDLHTSHVLPALLRKAHEAKVSGARSLVVWGTGAPRREFLHVEDCADALVHILKFYRGLEPINVGFGEDISILDLTRLVCDVVGFKGGIEHDLSKPDGTPRKLVNSDKLRALGWKPRIDLRAGLADTYQAFLRTLRGDGTPGG